MFERVEGTWQLSRLAGKLHSIGENDDFRLNGFVHQFCIVMHSLPRNGQECRSALLFSCIGVIK